MTEATITLGRHPKGEVEPAYTLGGARLAAAVLQRIDAPLAHLRECSLLDYGCGSGRVTRILALCFKRVVGYDRAGERLAQAAREQAETKEIWHHAFNDAGCGPDRRVANDLTYIGERAALGTYDYICCLLAIHDPAAPTAQAVRDDIRDLLKPGGCCVYCTTAGWSVVHTPQKGT